MSKDDIRRTRIERERAADAAHIGSRGAIVAAIVTAIVTAFITIPTTYFVTKAQIRVARDTLTLETLARETDKLETLSRQLVEVSIYVPPGMISANDMQVLQVKRVEAFLQMCRTIKPFSQFLNRATCEDLERVEKALGDCIFGVKNGTPPTQERFSSVVGEMNALFAKVGPEIDVLKRAKQEQITRLTSPIEQ